MRAGKLVVEDELVAWLRTVIVTEALVTWLRTAVATEAPVAWLYIAIAVVKGLATRLSIVAAAAKSMKDSWAEYCVAQQAAGYCCCWRASPCR